MYGTSVPTRLTRIDFPRADSTQSASAPYVKFECGIDSNQITKITIPANNNSSGHLEWTYDYYTSLGWEYKVKQVTGPTAGDDLPTIVSFTHDTKIVGNKNYKATMVRNAAWDIAAIDILYSQVSTMQ